MPATYFVLSSKEFAIVAVLQSQALKLIIHLLTLKVVPCSLSEGLRRCVHVAVSQIPANLVEVVFVLLINSSRIRQFPLILFALSLKETIVT